MKFYLGTHKIQWLWSTDVPLFISARRLADRAVRNLRSATAPRALDSGGFTELAMHGRWTVSAGEYVDQVSTWSERLGGFDFIAPQDWMCEPRMLERTGLTVAEHQRRTVDNLLDLRRQAPGLPIIPVLQGQTVSDYLRCADLYRAVGVDLCNEPLVGLGSVCRRQNTDDITDIVIALDGLRLHGFGVKTLGLRRYGHMLTSADSLAWSMEARRSDPLPGHPHKSCANCSTFAMQWRTRIVNQPLTPRAHQLRLDVGTGVR